MSLYSYCVYLNTGQPAHEVMALIALHKLNLQTRMRSNPMGLHVWFFQMRSLAWAFAVRLCGKYHNLMSWLRGCTIKAEMLENGQFSYRVQAVS